MFPFCGHGILEYDRNNIYSTNGNKQTAYYKKKLKLQHMKSTLYYWDRR